MELQLFLAQHRRAVIHRWLARHRAAKLITAALFIVLLAAIIGAIYYFVLAGFHYLQQNTAIEAVVSIYIYELFLLILSVLTVGGTIITTLFYFFRRSRDAWIMATPSLTTLFCSNVQEVIFDASWPFLLFAVPTAFALRSAFDLSFISLLIALVAIALLALVLAAATICLIFLLANLLNLLPGRPRLTFTNLISSLGVLAVIAIALLNHWSRNGNLFDFSALSLTSSNAPIIAQISQEFRWYPSHPVAQLLYALQTRDWLSVLQSAEILLWLVGIFAVLLKFFEPSYPLLWRRLQEGQLVASAEHRLTQYRLSPLLARAKTPLGAFAAKEVMLLWRDRQQLLWFSFLVGMWLVQTILVSGSARHQNGIGQGPSDILIQTLQFLVTLYFVATAILRFVFPTFSLERKSAWLIASTPLDLRQLLVAKSAWFTSLFVVLGVVISLLNLSILGVPLTQASVTIVSLLTAIAAMVQLGLYLSVRFPNFETDDPQTLSTSLPGLLLIALCLLFGGTGSLILQAYLHGNVADIVLWNLLGIGLSLVLYLAARRRLAHFEFTRIM